MSNRGRKADSEDVKAFKATLTGLSAESKKKFLKKYMEIQSEIQSEKEKNTIIKQLDSLPIADLEAAIARRAKATKKPETNKTTKKK